jgi:hypothetical protein
MATRKAGPKARSAGKSAAKKKTAAGRTQGLNLGKYMEEIKIGKYSWDDVLESTSMNMDALAEANRTIIQGYADIARRQYGMLKNLLRELRKVTGDRDEVVKELKRVVERARKDVKSLQTIATRTNSKAQRIVKKRAQANITAWKTLVAEARKSVGGRLPAIEMPTAAKKSAPKKKPAPKRKAVQKKKAAPRKKVAPRKKAASKKLRASPKRRSS